MRAVAILAAHRRDGLSAQMLAKVVAPIEGADHWTVDHVFLSDYQLEANQPTLGQPGLAELTAQLMAADVWLIAAPTYLGNTSGLMKHFLDCFRTRLYRVDQRGTIFPGKLAGKRYLVLTSCYASPVKNFLFRVTDPGLTLIDKTLQAAGLVKIGEAVLAGTWHLTALPQEKRTELNALGERVLNPQAKERMVLPMFRYLILLVVVALVSLVTMGIENWTFARLGLVGNFWGTWLFFVVVFFAILALILHLLTLAQHHFH